MAQYLKKHHVKLQYSWTENLIAHIDLVQPDYNKRRRTLQSSTSISVT